MLSWLGVIPRDRCQLTRWRKILSVFLNPSGFRCGQTKGVGVHNAVSFRVKV